MKRPTANEHIASEGILQAVNLVLYWLCKGNAELRYRKSRKWDPDTKKFQLSTFTF